MLLRTPFLLTFTLPLLSLSCSRDREPTPEEDTFTATATGALTFDLNGTSEGYLVYDPAKNRTVLDVDLVAPGGQWKSFSLNIWNFNREGVEDKTYIQFRNSPISEEHSFQITLVPDATPTGWVAFRAGQIQFEYYGADRVRGTFDGLIESNNFDIDPIEVSGTFDTAYKRVTR